MAGLCGWALSSWLGRAPELFGVYACIVLYNHVPFIFIELPLFHIMSHVLSFHHARSGDLHLTSLSSPSAVRRPRRGTQLLDEAELHVDKRKLLVTWRDPSTVAVFDGRGVRPGKAGGAQCRSVR